MITVTSVEAQNRFGQLLDTVQREPVVITRHGRTVAVMMTPQAFEAQQQGAGADAARQAGLAAIAAFRGAGRGGSVAQLLQDRQADRRTEARKEQSTPRKTRRKATSPK
jgi:prevent-host-death family protein